MIVVRLRGGLGNQMFQYAIGKNLALQNNTILKFDVSELEQDKLRHYELDIFNISGSIATRFTMMFVCIFNKRIMSKILGKYYLCIKQQDLYFNEKMLLKKGNIYLDGYWQSENYFKEIRNIIINDFMIKNKPDKRNKLMIEKIKNSNSVCIHIRRGDYISNAKTNKFHGHCSLKYYYNAIEIIIKKVKNPTFYIFSDDSQWTKENLKLKYPTIYVNINSPKKGYEDLRLMSNCKYFIIANSSFSWWGAWLSNTPNKIVCAPKRWFKSTYDEGDIIPKSWIRVEG